MVEAGLCHGQSQPNAFYLLETKTEGGKMDKQQATEGSSSKAALCIFEIISITVKP